jgi:hypothetical protein
VGAKRSRQTTLMSAFPSSRRVNSWLHSKQLIQALPGRAGGAVVIATVDQALIRELGTALRVCVSGLSTFSRERASGETWRHN